jgi:hypothetical protein
MNAVQTALNSPRFARYLLWFGAAVFAAGALALVFAFAGGSDKTSSAPDKGFHPKLPVKSKPLKNSHGVTIKTYSQLDPDVRRAVRKFIATAVARKHVGDSWGVVAPQLRAGYTLKQWTRAADLPVVPYPGVDVKHVQYYLDYASTKEILVEVGLAGLPGVSTRPVTFQLALVPVGSRTKYRWLVNYWMPRWTPPVPTDS